MASQVGKSIEDAAEKVGYHAERIGQSVERAANHAAANAGETAETVKQYAADGFDRFEVAVRRNPLASAAIAASVGFVLAALARR